MKSLNSIRLLATLATAVVVPGSGAAQATPDTAKAALIRQMIELTHAGDQAIGAMELAMPMQKAANPRIPAVFWDRFIALARARRGEFETMILSVYDHHFTTDELRQLLAFYRTPLGAKLLETQPTIVRESMLAGQEWGQKLGMEVAQQLAAEGVRIPPP